MEGVIGVVSASLFGAATAFAYSFYSQNPAAALAIGFVAVILLASFLYLRRHKVKEPQLTWDKMLREFKARNPVYQQYANTVQTELSVLSEADRTDAWHDANFKIVAAAVTLKRDTGCATEDCPIVAHVVFPEDPWVACTPDQRDRIEKAHAGKWPACNEAEAFLNGHAATMPPALMRFSAGGSLTILSVPKERNGRVFEDYIVVAQKDDRARIHPLHLVPSSGISEEPADWLNPNFIIASECVEEVRVLGRISNNWYYPQFDGADAILNDHVLATVEAHRGTVAIYQHRWPHEIPTRPQEATCTLVNCSSKLIPIGQDRLHITHEGKGEMNYQGLLVIDAEFGAIDLMAAVRIKIPEPLSDLRVLDGEAVTDKKSGQAKLLCRNVFLFSPNEFADLFHGERATAAAFFGRDSNGNWLDGKPVEVLPRPWINPPLRVAGPALLASYYKIPVAPFPATESRAPIIETLL